MALTQMQLIQSLGEAMSWFERELQWGVEPTELRHLCGRIGELYAALMTNGQLAQRVNQPGYDVVSSRGERISVKTTAIMNGAGHVAFNAKSLELVDRIIILRMNTDEMQIETLLDATLAELDPLLTATTAGKRTLSLSKLLAKSQPTRRAATSTEVRYQGYLVRELENGTIEVERDGIALHPVKPVLRELAMRLNVGLLNGRGNTLNTRQLGTEIIQSIDALTNQHHPATSTLAEEL